MLHEYCTKMEILSKRIAIILLQCLGDGIVKKYYESEFGKCQGYLRIINYTPPNEIEGKEEIEGLGVHTDMSCITIVNQDEIGSLQVRSKEGKWMNLKPCEGTLVVNVGDLLQAWSRRSSEHRCVLKPLLGRLTLAFFWCFEDEKLIKALKEVVGEKKERAYRPFVCRLHKI